MKLRHITAGLLAVLLVCGAAWAGICPLRCELRRDRSMQSQIAAEPEMAMEHCHGMMGAAGKHTVSAGCDATPCSHAEVSAAVADEGGRAWLMVAQPIIVVETVMAWRPLGAGAARGDAEGPPRAGVGFAPLIVSLRV